MKKLIFTALDNCITHFELANNYGPAPGSPGQLFDNLKIIDRTPFTREELERIDEITARLQ